MVKPRSSDERLEAEINHWLTQSGAGATARWGVNYDFHAGGYAKLPTALLDFMLDFESQTGIALDPVYTAKMLWGIESLAAQGRWRAGDNVLALHTGGLQGRRGFPALSG